MRRNNSLSHMLLGAALTLGASQAMALQELDDSSLSEVQGAGLAFAFEDFRFQMAPTSYFEQMGGEPDPNTTFNRGNFRWIGTTISSGEDVSGELYHFSDYGAGAHGFAPTATCSISISSLDCPIARGPVKGYADLNNPFLLRVREYEAVGRAAINGDWVEGETNTVAELIGPTRSSPFRWSFWGEVEVTNDAGTTQLGLLQNQEIIIGAPVSRFKPDGSNAADDGTAIDHKGDASIAGPIFRMFSNQTDNSLGMIYHHRLSGDYRFSVAQSSADNSHGVPTFAPEEGMYFTNVNAYLPLGQIHYQSLILDGTANKDGNFIVELSRLPDDPQAYNDFYSSADASGYQRSGRPDRYYETHGYVRWGDKFPDSPGGVSEVRFSGPGTTSTTQSVSYSLPALQVIEENFPNADPGFCTNAGVFSGGDDNCSSWNGQWAPAVNRSITFTGVPQVNSTNSKVDLLNEGGMVFVSASGSTWKVPDNPNLTGERMLGFALGSLMSDRNVKLARTNGGSCNFFGANCQLRPRSGGPNTGAIDNRARAIINEAGGISPVVEVNAVNLGSSRVEGMNIQHLKITTLGAAN